MTFPISNQWTDLESLNAAKLNARVDARLNALYNLIANPTRHGCKMTTNTGQSISASSGTILNNNGVAWTTTEDTDGFAAGGAGSTAPIKIPTGFGGLYVVGFHFLVAAVPTGLIWGAGLLNGGGLGTNGFASGWQITRVAGTAIVSLNVNDTVGIEGFTSTATTISAGSFVYCYRISA